MRRAAAQVGRELAEGQLDRVEVRRIGRQVPQVAAGPLDHGPHVGVAMHAEVVEDDRGAAALVVTRRLIQEARTRNRWPNQPTTRRLK